MFMENKPGVGEMGGSQQPVNQGLPVPYTGIIAVIQTALTGSGNMVRANLSGNTGPVDARVNPASLRPFVDPQKPAVQMFQITDATDSTKNYLFMGDSTGTRLMLDSGKPLVSFAGATVQPPMNQPMPFSGAIAAVQGALSGSANAVRVLVPGSAAMTDAVVNPTTLLAMNNPQKPGTQIYTAADSIDAVRVYIFLADSQTGQLIINNGKSVVSEIVMK
jgi:hypothetical protein